MAHCSDALSHAWMRMVSLLFLPFRLIFWIKMAILSLLLSGMNPANYFTQRYGGPSSPDDIRAFTDNFLDRLPLLIFIIALVIVLTILFSFLIAAARFIFYDSIRNGTCYYMASFNRHASGILSYFLWNIAVFMIVTVLFLVLGAIVLVLGYLLYDALGTGLILLFVAFGAGLFLILFVGFIVYWTLLDAMVLPIMIVEQVGIFEAWRRALAHAFSRMAEFLGYLVIRFLINLGIGVILFLIGLFIAAATFLILLLTSGVVDPNEFNRFFYSIAALPVWLILSIIQLPFPVFLDAYAFYFVGGITGNAEYYRQDGDNLVMEDNLATRDAEYESDSSDSSFEHPAPPAASGPVHFSDIPSESYESEPDTGAPPPDRHSSSDEPPAPR